MNKENEVQFWTNENGKAIKINQSKLISSINNLGYTNLKVNSHNYVLVKCLNNKISHTSEQEIIYEINQILKEKASEEVQEVFIRGVGSYICPKKLNLLNTIVFNKEKDDKLSSYFFFNNLFCKINKDAIEQMEYQNLNFPLWEDKMLKVDYSTPQNNELGDFEKFCRNINSNDTERFLSFKSMIGYLLHRNKEVGEPKAVILYDAEMGKNNQAQGGTGKTIIINALKNCRELVYVSGKEMKSGSFFKNQRINITTDLIAYDDLKENVHFEEFYTTITSGIEVEKKGKQSFMIEYEDAPKLILSSNYIIKGDGGNSDLRRRYEFEIVNHYNKDYTPEMEFGKRFFSKDWDVNEWNKFYYFMMNCLKDYLNYGLLDVEPINLKRNKTITKTNIEFINFAEKNFVINDWMDKRELEEHFKINYSQYTNVSAHQFSKWITDYSTDNNYTYEKNSSGGNYMFKLNEKEVKNV